MKEEEPEEKEPQIIMGRRGTGKTSLLYTKVLTDLLLERSTPSFTSELISLFSKNKNQEKKTLEEQKSALVKELLESDIDPVAFDVLISNEINRRLKVRFGVAFLILTLVFTLVSYAIVILDGIYDWKISDIAITALIIEIPIQFVGLLYIIARNLFPNTNGDEQLKVGKLKTDKKDKETDS